MGTLGQKRGRGSGTVPAASSSAPWRPAQPGTAPNHQLVLLGRLRAPSVASATEGRAQRQPSAACNSCPRAPPPSQACPPALPGRALSQITGLCRGQNAAVAVGSHAGTVQRLNFSGVHSRLTVC